MDRRYDQPPRDRYMHARPRFEDRPPMRDERYYRREEGGGSRPWSHPRYPSFSQPLRRHDEPPHYYQERREHYKPYDRRPLPRKEPERIPSSRYPDKREVKSVIVASRREEKEEEETKKEKLVVVEKRMEEKVVSATEKTVSNEEPKRMEEPKAKKARVYKEAVVSFDSDGEDDVMQADWGNESDDASAEVDRQPKETVTKEAEVEEPLPENWAMHVTDKGEKYYYNKITRESVWERPTITKKEKLIVVEEKEEKQVIVKDSDINKDRDTSPIKKEINQRPVVVNKRKFVLPDRDEPRLPSSLANRISYPHRKNMNEPGYSRRFESDRLRERPLPPPLPRSHHMKPHHRYNNGPPHAGPPLPHPDRYYRSNSREPWTHHAPYRHHQMDYAPLPPPPPPRWVSGRRVDFDRRDAPPPYMNRHYR